MGMKGAYVWCETRSWGNKVIFDCVEPLKDEAKLLINILKD